MAEKKKKQGLSAEERAKKTEKVAEEWKPRTALGRQVKDGQIADIEIILDSGQVILEPEIVDVLIPNLESDLLMIGQSKGKFGGGQRRAFRQTQKKTEEGSSVSFSTYAVVGNRNGYIGVGFGKAKETIPSREKAFRKAKLNIMKVRRGCGDWKCGCRTPHSLPFSVKGKCGSVEIELYPAPKGTGLCAEKECRKILALAGYKDVWSDARGQTRVKINLVKALMKAFKELVETKVPEKYKEQLGIVEGRVRKENE
jgi:small subunit ribosomal protein S5